MVRLGCRGPAYLYACAMHGDIEWWKALVIHLVMDLIGYLDAVKPSCGNIRGPGGSGLLAN